MNRLSRAIRIDKGRIRALSATIQDKVEDYVERKSGPIGKQVIVPSLPFEIDDVRGSPLSIRIRIETLPSNGGLYVCGGGKGTDRSGTPVVIVYLNANITAEVYAKSARGCDLIAKQVYDALIHEITHAADTFSRGTAEDMSRSEAESSTAYYNNPGEVRAYLQEIIDEVESSAFAKNIDKMVKVFGTYGKAVEVVLKNSRVWQEIEPYLNERNKRLIAKAVAQTLEDMQRAKRVVAQANQARQSR